MTRARTQRKVRRAAAAGRPPTGEPERSCVVTRTAGDPDDLVRLVIGLEGEVVVDPSGRCPGRGAWILPTAEVIAQAEARPGLIAKALKVESVVVRGLRAQVQAAAQAKVLQLLPLASRAGLVAGGAEQLEAAVRSGEVVALLVANDAADASVEKIASLIPHVKPVVLPLTCNELGQRIGKGARALIGLRSGSVTRAIMKQLPRMVELR